MKPLIAIYSCEKDRTNGRNEAIRQTWMKRAGWADVKFFIGDQLNLDSEDSFYYKSPDEIVVNAYDGGDNLVYKEIAMLRWALNRGYEKILKTETDAYLVADKISKQIFDKDWTGAFHENGPGTIFRSTGFYDFAQGHAVWYTRKTAEYIVNELKARAEAGPNEENLRGLGFNTSLRSGDVWVSQVLTPHVLAGDITVSDDRRFGPGPLSWHHSNRPGEDKQWDSRPVVEFMYNMEREIYV